MGMTEDRFLVLNCIYLKKIATARAASEATGQSEATVRDNLAEAQAAGLVVDVGQGMLMLSEDGVRSVLGEYAGRHAASRDDASIAEWYSRFESLNTQFLAAVTAWQQDSGDAARTERLIKLVERQVRALDSVSDRIPRYASYSRRFSHAIDRVDAGETRYLASPDVDSIHNIWFEFHEDILTVLGRPRDVAESGL
jgi:hypothetical protein